MTTPEDTGREPVRQHLHINYTVSLYNAAGFLIDDPHPADVHHPCARSCAEHQAALGALLALAGHHVRHGSGHRASDEDLGMVLENVGELIERIADDTYRHIEELVDALTGGASDEEPAEKKGAGDEG